MNQPDIFGKTLTELKEITNSLNLPSYTGLQLSDWLYKKHALTFDQMSNLSKQTRKTLSDHYILKRTTPSGVQNSRDGTRK